MRAGTKRSTLLYQTKTQLPDALGQLVPTWVTIPAGATFTPHRCEVRAPRGDEPTVALQVKAFVSLVIECRYPGYCFDPDGQLLDVTDPAHPKIYNIISSVDPDGKRRRLVTMATQVASAVSTNTSNL
jgi:hypothetical protein